MAPRSEQMVKIPSSSSSVTVASSEVSLKSAKSIASCPPSPNSETPQSQYRPARHLPYELQEHCAIYLEERLYCQALSFLISLVSAGAASSTPRPALLPPPQFFRLISTLTVHPTITNRAKTADKIQAANLAHRYLRLVLKHAGPIQSNLAEAFRFVGVGGRVTGRKRNGDVSPEKDHIETIENDLANSAALYAQTPNFWLIVGWAFNCSVLHKRRWEWWSLWLDYMLEVLETDWSIQFAQNQAEESIIVQYIISGGGQSDSGRKILRAIFADGKKISVGEFKEVWQNETRELRKEDDVKKEKTIDIEVDDYGDYLSDEDDADLDEASAHSAASDRSASSTKSAQENPHGELLNVTDRYGGAIALNLRFRLLSLLSNVANANPSALTWSAQQVTGGVERLYDLILEHIRHEPLPTFFLFMSPSTLRPFHPTAASVMTQYLLHRGSLVEGAAPEPASYVLTEESLLECHLPWAASNNSVADNAKVSICVETLVRLLDRHGGGLSWTQELEDVVEGGIKRREEKAKGMKGKRGRKKKGAPAVNDQVEEWQYLRDSAARLRLFVQLTKESTPATQQTVETQSSEINEK